MEEEIKQPHTTTTATPDNLINTRAQLLSDAKAEGNGEKTDELVEKVYEWAVEQMRREKERLKGLGVEPIDLQVIDMSVLVEGKKKQINRLIFNAEIDFTQVTNILIS